MPFKEVVAAGVYLVREALRSPNFVTGVSGWTINRDGSAEFNNVIVRGTVTGAIFQSTNYVAGVSGFQLNGNTGTVEFNSPVTINGPLTVSGDIQSANWVSQLAGFKLFGTTGNAEFNGNVDIYSSGNLTIHDGTNEVSLENSGGIGGLYFNPGGSGGQGAILAQGGSPSTLEISSPRPTDPPGADYPPRMGLTFFSGRNAGGFDFYGETTFFSEDAGDPIAPTILGAFPRITLFDNGGQNRCVLRIQTTQDVSPTSIGHGLQIGPETGQNLRMDNNEIMSVNNGVVADLFIQNDGGVTFFGNNAPADVVISGSLDAAGLVSFPAMDGARDSDTATRTTTSQSMVALTGQVNVTVARPPSGRLLVLLSGHVFNAGSATTQNYLGFEIRDTNSAGTVRLAATFQRAGVATGAQDQSAAFMYLSDALAGSSANLWVGLLAQIESGGAGTLSVLNQSLSVIPQP